MNKCSNCLRYFLAVACILAFAGIACSQTSSVKGFIYSSGTKEPIPFASIFIEELKRGTTSGENGEFSIENLPPGKYRLTISCLGCINQTQEITVGDKDINLSFYLETKVKGLKELEIKGERERTSGISRMKPVSEMAIYEGKKNEVILLRDIDANLATNNTRQVFAKVPGINIIENDGAGIQLGIAVRGLNPHRISEFNSRQNGYDISADALGYPESYYTPPMEAVERIEVVRGAASLQYGSQFGGLLNFIFLEGNKVKPIEFTSQQTIGSFGLFNSFNSIGGTKGRHNYFALFHHKQGKGYRENSGFGINTGYFSLKTAVSNRLTLKTQITAMSYNMQQPGGLTDKDFEKDPRASERDRNWFHASWFIPALIVDYSFSETSRINIRNFGLIAGRSSLGNLIPPNQPDYTLNRDLSVDNYLNIGSETRFITNYTLFGKENTVLTGFRYYRGNTHRRQGYGTSASDADYTFINPSDLEGSDFKFPSTNMAVFAENIFHISSAFSITPGVRYEYIETNARGTYREDFEQKAEVKNKRRSFPLLGIGLSYHFNDITNAYGNISQAYTGINFNDIRVLNRNFRVDPDLEDVKGYNADLGIRGRIKKHVSFDMSVFYLAYNNRIGIVNTYDEDFNTYRFRTNVADSRSTGTEVFAEADILGLLQLGRFGSLSAYTSIAYVDARYINTNAKSILDKKVEYAPELIQRYGINYKYQQFSASFQYSMVSEQYTDATNTSFTSNAVNGLIPAYSLADFSVTQKIKLFSLSAGVNNLFDESYFTRRADGYPGPGILPADGRNFYFTLGIKL